MRPPPRRDPGPGRGSRRLARALLRLLGRRLPRHSGRVRLDGPSAPITIRRDRWGVPHLSAATDGDAWFGLGFCHGQDRAFQLEILLRAARGRLAEVLGPRAVPVDRLMRRLGVQRSAQAQLAVAAADVTAVLTAYVEGVNAAVRRGPRPHELVLLRARPTPWRASDVLAVAALQSLALSGNWDSELARLAILEADGPDALRAVDPAYGAWDGAAPTLGATPSDASPLAADMELLAGLVGVGVGIGASNNWALAPSRTRGGSALLANDPHLAPGVPGPWYLAHIETPEWSLSGASFVGAPSFPIGQNGFAAWGITAGLSDASDLFVVEPGPDGASVRSGDELVECDVIDERIGVRGGPAVVERVVVTPWGPLISPVLEGVHRALAIRAVWLEPHPVRGLLGVARATSFAAFREAFADWPGPALNVAYADAAGHVAWQLVGRVPSRRRGHGLLPAPAGPDAGWDGLVPWERMPWLLDPADGFTASANAAPPDGDSRGPWLGADWLDSYREARIAETLRSRHDWDVEGCLALQLDVASLPWRELRGPILAALDASTHAGSDGGGRPDDDARRGADLLRAWDGEVSAVSPAAAVYELLVAELAVRAARRLAPRSWRHALGAGFGRALPSTLFVARSTAWLSRLLRAAGHNGDALRADVPEATAAAVRALRERHGDDEAGWAWGRVRRLTLRHLLGEVPRIGGAFDVGPVAMGGDVNTVCQAGARPLDPLGNPGAIANCRAVMDTADPDASRFVLAGGQSGNPLSPHYADLFALWQRGQAVAIPWSEDAIRRGTVATLVLEPTG